MPETIKLLLLAGFVYNLYSKVVQSKAQVLGYHCTFGSFWVSNTTKFGLLLEKRDSELAQMEKTSLY